MVQHLLLMAVAPPLILLGAPFLPMLRGLPRVLAHDGIGPFLTWPALRRCGHALTHPVVCWLAMAVSLCAWHVPAAFDLALRSPGWHRVEHASFFGTSLLFWWPVVRPFPSRPHWPLWAIPLYLLAADLVNTVICGALIFSEHPLYATYEAVPRLFGTTALSDQIAAGVIMWVPGSMILLIPAIALVVQYLSSGERLASPALVAVHNGPGSSRDAGWLRPMRGAFAGALRGLADARSARRSLGDTGIPRREPGNEGGARGAVFAGFDLLRVPFIGRFLRAKAGRRAMQAVMLVIALAVMADGFFGTPVSAANLAGVLPWIYWRGFTVLALLVAGNLFCMACPFMLPRELARRFFKPVRHWPRRLRNKWLAIALFALILFAYELFDLWGSPWWTAWLIVAYFAAALLVDSLFRNASFCKWVCPIGQFNFVASMVSPLEVRVRDTDVCASLHDARLHPRHAALRGRCGHPSAGL